MNKKLGQVTIFVIVALMVVGGILVYLATRDNLSTTGNAGEFAPIFNTYQLCIEQQTKDAISLASLQGGHVDLGTYVPGSDYLPFSSNLLYLGTPVPYWYYLTGNNLIKENVPTISSMQKEIASYVQDHLGECDFGPYLAQGYEITSAKTTVTSTIDSKSVRTSVKGSLTVSRGGSTETKAINEATVSSKLGTFYNIAKSVYDKEKQEAFIEKYSVDVLRLYAPVDGIAVQCSPKIWKSREVVSDVQDALVANIGSIKFASSKPSGDNGYFTVPLSTSEPIRLVYSKDWSSVFEITPADQELMIADPVGNQEGMGVMGFCYVPYHFVYDARFPVMVQVGDGLDFFQFPVSVIINKNVPRNALLGDAPDEELNDVCNFKSARTSITTYDSDLKPVEARVSYQCFDKTCPIGTTNLDGGVAKLDASLPACVNGRLIVESEGYARNEQVYSSNSEQSAEVILDKEYDTNVVLKVNGKPFTGTAIVQFSSADGVASAALPEVSNVNLHEGLYNISVYAYGNSSIPIASTTRTQCTQVSRGGVLGFFGQTKEQCFTVTIPASTIDTALVGGGKTSAYLLRSDLGNGKIVLDVNGFASPTSLEQVQYNFNSVDNSDVEVSFQ